MAVPETVNVAVIVVLVVTVTLLAVIPVPLKLIEAGVKKLVPVSVMVPVVVPCALLDWLSEVSVGAPSTVNGLLPEVPPEVITVTFWTPVVAVPEIANVAVMLVELTTTRLLTVIPEPLNWIVAPETKLVPVSVSLTVPPCAPMATLSEVRVGAGGLTVNCTTLAVVSPSVVTNTVWAPSVAPAAIVNVAVIVVLLVTVTLFAVMPLPLKEIEAGVKKFEPVRVIVPVVVP